MWMTFDPGINRNSKKQIFEETSMKETELWIFHARKILDETQEILKSKKYKIDLTSKVLLKK